MALYLVQHGKALPKEQDPEQHLSEEGRTEVRQMAELLKKYEISVRRVEHSGKLRAKETAEIFAAELKPEMGIGERKGIQPLDDVGPLKDQLNAEENLMLVGHLPFMEKLVSYLIIGSEEPRVIKFQNAGVVCLDQFPESKNWYLKWALMPNLK